MGARLVRRGLRLIDGRDQLSSTAVVRVYQCITKPTSGDFVTEEHSGYKIARLGKSVRPGYQCEEEFLPRLSTWLPPLWQPKVWGYR